ncbi:MAG: hypothetical protein EOP06_22345 [Proteobacteria bacterium]|nr:MAG: hypothetical protein EOP06_22345 [Pseudomonadota bacterium]
MHAILKSAVNVGIHPQKNKNPYWNLNAFTIPDPDGFNVILSLRSPALRSPGKYTQIAAAHGIVD